MRKKQKSQEFELRSVSAGFPSPAEDLAKSPLDLNTLLITDSASTFFLKASGDSMIEAGILDGDILVVDKSLSPKNRDIVIASINGEFMVKRYLCEKNGNKSLHAENKLFPPVKITAFSEAKIWGVVTSAIHRF